MNEKEKEEDKEKLREKKKERKLSFYAQETNVKKVLYSNQPIIVLLDNEADLNANKLNVSLLGVFSSLL